MPWDLGLVESPSRRQGLHYTLSGPTNWCWWPVRAGNTPAGETVTPEELPRIPLVLRESGGDARSDRRGPCGQRHPSLAVR